MTELPTFLVDGTNVPMDKLRSFLARLSEQAASALLNTVDGAKPVATLAAAQAAPAVAAGTQVRVFADPDATKNGLYVNRTGAVGGYVLDMTFYTAVANVLNPQVEQVSLVAGAVSGGAVALPIGGNPNDLAASVAGASDEKPFDMLIVKTNTGASFLEAGGIRRQIVNGGGGVALAAGDLPSGSMATLQYSAGGGSFVLTGLRPVRVTPPPIGIDDAAIRDQPWGIVRFQSGSPRVQPSQIYVTVVGSSNAAAGYMPAELEPASVAAQTLSDYFIGDGIQFIADNQARAGAPMVDIVNQLGLSAKFQAGASRFVLSFCWMNDARTIFYHSQGGILAERNALRAAIPIIRAKGAEPILVTGFHPDPRAIATALDAGWFSDTRAFPSGGSGQDMHYPAFKASPVAPLDDMVPRADAMTVVRDWSGSGIARTGSVRVWHVNNLIRRVAQETGCILLDFERLSFRKTIETVPDLSSGLNTWYDQGNPLHPKAAMYEQVISPLIAQWAYEMSRGNTNRRVFDGI